MIFAAAAAEGVSISELLRQIVLPAAAERVSVSVEEMRSQISRDKGREQ
jgi:predicted nuclease of restriction endonuclease-like RecB superfamily